MTTAKILYLLVFLSNGALAFSQTKIDSALSKIDLQKWAATIEKKNGRLEKKIVSRSDKALRKLQSQEEKIYTKMLQGKDSLQAKALLAQAREKYARLLNNINRPPGIQTITCYVPGLDTLNTTLKFLYESKGGESLRKAFTQTKELQDRFQQAEEIRRFIRERKQQLKAQLENLGLVKQLKQFNKQAYYYSEQMKEYAEVFSNPKKAQKKAVDLLSKTKVFQDFMRKNSMLASLLRLPGGDDLPSFGGTGGGLAGLQTRAQVNNLIQQQLASGGPNAMNQFKQNIADAQSQLNQLKEKLLKTSSSGGGKEGASDDIMPEGFKPNNQKTKNFLKRLEYGTNIQTQHATSFFPVTSDIGLSLGYKLGEKSVIGFGASYKMGWGRGWNNISITNEGVGLRSFIDLKLPSPFGGAGGGFWISGGYEQNFKSSFSDFSQLRNYSGWQSSGLIGLSKILSLRSSKGGAGGGFFKKTKLQLLWDFLSNEQIPKTQPIVFRVGYSFN